MQDDDDFNDEFLEEKQIAEEQLSEEELLKAAGLDVTIGELEILRPPVKCETGTMIRAAIRTMHDEQVGFILVVKDERLIGIFTERHLLTTIAAGEIDVDTEPVDTVMDANPESLGETYDLAYAINRMSVAGHRHIPIVDADGRPTHVISARNVVEHFAEKFAKEVVNLPPDPEHAIPITAEGG